MGTQGGHRGHILFPKLTYASIFADTGRGKLTVGKLYGGILIHENWRNTKFGQIEELRKQEAELEELERAEALAAAENTVKGKFILKPLETNFKLQ